MSGRGGPRPWVLAAASVAAPLVLLAGWLVANDRNPTLGWFVGVATLSALMVATVLRDRSRASSARAMAAWARAVGWVPAGARPPVGQWLGAAAVEDALTGRHRGRSAVTLGCATADGVQLRATQVRYHVVAVQLPNALPTVWLTPRRADAPAVAGGGEVLFESAEFNDAWRVTGDDPRFVHAAVTPQVMSRLLRPDAVGLELRTEGAWLVHWRLGRPDPASTERALGVLGDLVDALPPFVWQRYGGRVAPRP